MSVITANFSCSRVPFNNDYFKAYKLIWNGVYRAISDKRYLYKTLVLDKGKGLMVNFGLRAHTKELINSCVTASEEVVLITVDLCESLTDDAYLIDSAYC